MQVLHVCSEMFPLLKTGGLADVLGALPAAQIAGGVDTRVLLPAFPDIRRGIPDAKVVTRRETFAGRITLLFGHYNGVGIYLIDAPHLYDRPGSPYHDTNLFAYTDNVLRFALLGWVGAEMATGLDPFWRPDVVHAHDWHAGLAPAYLAARGHPAKSVFTVHNLAYQGMYYAHHMNDIDLPWSFFNMHGLEFNGQISFLKAGLYYADHITAVSPTYAREITQPAFGYGMEGLLQQRHRQDGEAEEPRHHPLPGRDTQRLLARHLQGGAHHEYGGTEEAQACRKGEDTRLHLGHREQRQALDSGLLYHARRQGGEDGAHHPHRYLEGRRRLQ